MIARLRPSNALLAATALWGVALGGLAVLGLGGNVGPHPENAALAPPLPAVSLAEMPARLGPLPQYADVAGRPLLNADRRPVAVTAEAGPDDAPLDMTLTSVLIAGDVRLAILERPDEAVAHRVRVGDVLPGTGWRLVDVQPRLAVFEGPQGRRELELRVFDGTGGPMPPPMAPAADAAAVAPANAAPANAPAPAPDAPANAAAAAPPANTAEPAPMTPEQQVEAIRRRIEARRAMRAQEGARERAAAGDNR